MALFVFPVTFASDSFETIQIVHNTEAEIVGV